MRCSERIECLLTTTVIMNLIIMGVLIFSRGFGELEMILMLLEVFVFVIFYCYTHFVSSKTRYITDYQVVENPTEVELNLKAHEKCHEQKRHFQVALALIELGENEKAISYIDSIMKEIA